MIALPPSLHLDLTLQALSAGKHVLVEKPAYPRMEDYRAVLDARARAEAAGADPIEAIMEAAHG